MEDEAGVELAADVEERGGLGAVVDEAAEAVEVERVGDGGDGGVDGGGGGGGGGRRWLHPFRGR